MEWEELQVWGIQAQVSCPGFSFPVFWPLLVEVNVDPLWNISGPLQRLSLISWPILFAWYYSFVRGCCRGCGWGVLHFKFWGLQKGKKQVCACLILKYQSQGDDILRARARGGAEQSACNLEHHWWQWGLETEDRGGYIVSHILKSKSDISNLYVRRLWRWSDHC